VLKTDQVNIAMHGHNPLLSDVICAAAQDQVFSSLPSRSVQGHQCRRTVLHRERDAHASWRPIAGII